jgi:hypothetical protein
MKLFSTEYIQKLNATEGAGLFMQAVEVVESTSPLVVHRFVTHERALTYQGNVYVPLDMQWSGFELQRGMELPTLSIAVPSLNGTVARWVREKAILEHDVTLLILHQDLLDDVQARDLIRLQIQSLDDNPVAGVAVCSLGLNLALADLIPREVMTKKEFPGIPDDRVRISA